MNKHSFKTIWNTKRGILMAACETASSNGKKASGATLLLGAAAILPLVTQAQIMADPSKPQGQQPIVLSAGNGVPVVNIQTPTAGGVSMNQFSQFNVNSNGAILNNGRQNTQTQLAGWIQANPYLATGSASVIVNQVNSNNPTLLNGYIEVAGQRASVIIANPSGISVNGGGFINAQSATLTTGTPNFNGNIITGYTVNQGSVQINGAGLDTSTTDYTALLARAAQINAGIWAKNLDVVTGANQINVASVGATPASIAPAPATGAVPAFAIDVASLGGMYAGKIYLMGTEAGVGMKNSGTIMGTNANLYAGAGDVTISVDGILSNKGTIQSDGATHISSNSLNNLGAARIYGNDVSISTGSLINTNETVAGINTAPVIASRGNMTIAAANILNTENATLMSLGEMNLTATNSIINGSALIQTGGNLTINAPDIQNNNNHYSVVQVPYGNSTSVTAYQSPTSVGGSGTIYTSNNVTQVGCDAGPCYNSNTGEYFENYIVYNYTTSQTKTQVATSAPAQILVGKNLNLAAGTLTNNASTIVVGGNLTGNLANLVNTPTLGNITTTDDGTSQYTNTWYHGKIGGHGRDWGSVNPYQNVTIQSINLGVSNSTFNTVPVSNPAVSNSALYKVVTNPTSNYLIATDPQFTNYQTWIGSDYLLAQMNLDPTTTQKRLGDAFYEQQLVQQQVSQLTGKAFLAGYQNNEDEYKALMTNGATFARAHQLTVGVALTASQLAELTSDVVWLIAETVVLPNGATTTALVPQVYVAKTGGLTSGGSLISASNILLNLQNNLTNAGVIAGTNLLAITAGRISNGGALQGANVALAATNDINITGGTVQATSNAILTAGGNITVQSATSTASGAIGSSNSGSTYSNTVLDRMAGIYVTNPNGTLVASAGNTLALNAANIQSAGSMALAGGNIIMGTVTTGSSSNQSYGGGNFVSQGTSTDVGSTLHAEGNISASASNVLVGVAVNLSGAGTVALSGANGVSLLAGQSASTSAMRMTSGSSGLLSSKTSTQGQAASSSAIGSTVTGGNLQITSSTGNVTLQASNINANDISLSAVNGTVALTSANQSRFYSTATTSGSTLTQGASGNGQTSTTASLTQLSGNLTIAAKQVTVDTRAQPSEAWITQLQNDPNLAGKVNWSQIDEAHKSWNYNQQGLSPAGAAILAIAVAVATSGVGSELAATATSTTAGVTSSSVAGMTLSSTTAATATSAAVTTYTAAGAALNAGFSALAAQAAVSLANNQGDIGKTLQQLGSDASLKQTLAAMLTAGVGTAMPSAEMSGIAAQTAAGCATGEMTGAGCSQGASTAAVLAGAANIYTNAVGYAANARPGENRNGVGQTNQSYEPDPITGQQKPIDRGINVVGNNPSAEYIQNNTANGQLAGCYQGSACSRALNQVPFINATAGLHDFIFNADWLKQTAFNNIWTMPASALLAIPAPVNDPSLSWLLNYRLENSSPPKPIIPSIIRIQPTQAPNQ